MHTSYDTDHDYDRPKREATYWWMDRWLRGSTAAEPSPEPETVTLPEEAVTNLAVEQPPDKGFSEVARLSRAARSVTSPAGASPGDDSPHAQARRGKLVVLPDVRTFGHLFSTGTEDAAAQTRAWERNGIVWGRPVAGMAVTDLQAVIDGMASYTCDGVGATADTQHVRIVARGSGDLAAASLFAMILDPRVAEADLDFAHACYEQHTLMLVPWVLLYGDIPRSG